MICLMAWHLASKAGNWELPPSTGIVCMIVASLSVNASSTYPNTHETAKTKRKNANAHAHAITTPS